MLATKFLPKFFKEVMTHIPTLALKSMDWKGIVKEIAPMAGRMAKKHLDPACLATLKDQGIGGVWFIEADLTNNYEDLSKEQKRIAGESVLELYFSQLKNPAGLCLDLRPKHFRCEGERLLFAPNNVWFRFEDSFRLALVDLYKGFYHDKEELFDKALFGIGLTQGLAPESCRRLKELFRSHFGPGEQEEVVFSLEHFQESFYQLFQFFMDHKVALNKDFMFLGIYLVGLYLNLQELKIPLNVRNSFMKTFPEV